MNNFFLFYADLFILISSFILTIAYTFHIAKLAVMPVRRIPLFFLLFGPMNICLNMCGHLGEISFRSIQQVIAGSFVYDFRFYSLILMGVVVMSISLYMLLQIKAWCTGDKHGKMNFIKAAIAVSVLTAPTAFFTPIGLLPTLACAISFIALPFTANRNAKKITVTENLIEA